jgi:steroid 5-alpha reductase family enzyme
MSLLELAGLSAGVVAGCMLALWLLSLALRNASIVDVFWGLGFVILAFVFLAAADGYTGRKALVTALVAIWGLRLSLHIARRNRGHGEDYRYVEFRRRAGPKWWWFSLFQVFLLQGLLMWLIAMPVLAAQHYRSPDELTAIDLAGALVWATGFFFESVGDLQLERFKADPANAGKVMRGGLWRYTRHPNYFGDATVWWGLFVVAAATGDGLWTVFSPIVMTTLLLRVSGVALLERRQTKAKPEYADYVANTSAFIPWFPRASR